MRLNKSHITWKCTLRAFHDQQMGNQSQCNKTIFMWNAPKQVRHSSITPTKHVLKSAHNRYSLQAFKHISQSSPLAASLAWQSVWGKCGSNTLSQAERQLHYRRMCQPRFPLPYTATAMTSSPESNCNCGRVCDWGRERRQERGSGESWINCRHEACVVSHERRRRLAMRRSQCHAHSLSRSLPLYLPGESKLMTSQLSNLC